MGQVTLGLPKRASATVDADALARDLASVVRGEVRFDAGSKAMYAMDASAYRQVPIGVVMPADPEDAATAIAVCRAHDAPVLSRGGGTSLAGQCCNVAVVLDWSKYANRIESIDPDRRRAIVQPGIVLDTLNARTRQHGLVFGPRPATHNRCTLGGMIGNNSCGSTAQWSGTTAANVSRLEILTYDGTRMWVGATPDTEYERIIAADDARARIYASLRELRDQYGESVRRRFPQIPRRISGYNLDSLLPEHDFHLARALVGTEGTCVTILRAELELLPEPAAQVMVLLTYPDIIAAAAAVPAVNRHQPYVLEGIDHRLIDFERRKHLHPEVVRHLPEQAALLVVELPGDTEAEARQRAQALIDDVGREATSARLVDNDRHRAEIWQVREAGLGATARVPGLRETQPGWEDSAVAPEVLADYLRDLRQLQRRYDLEHASVYGHFGHGCVHSRMEFDLRTHRGIQRYREFLTAAADLVVSHGGSLSGEHGDGQARGELLGRMFGAELLEAFSRFKAVFDPGNRMNPGKVVHPYPLDTDLRVGPGYAPAQPATHFTYSHDSGSLATATERCVGVGECRRAGGGVMCPSYMVTREERHSTRGRAHLLNEMLRGEVITGGWSSPEVAEALDLCLACKGCKTDCPVNVDMATYKAEFLSHHYAGRIRPRSHYSLGWLPLWSQLLSPAPAIANVAIQLPGMRRVAAWLAGIDPERELPKFAPARFTGWYRRRGPRGSGHRGEVLLWPDTFTNTFAPEIAVAAVVVLEAAGFHVTIPHRPVCCGLTWISTGQLEVAKRVLRRSMATVKAAVQAGVPVVGLEPSCASVLRADAVELIGSDEFELLRKHTRTLAELLGERAPEFAPELRSADGGQVHAIVQTHCHQHAVLGFEADRRLMERVGMAVEVLDSGCCGLAGDFGMTRAHREVSLACAERVLLPEVRDAAPDTLVLADGFSCRTQIDQARTGRRAVHLAAPLAAAVQGRRLGSFPERDLFNGRRGTYRAQEPDHTVL